MDRVLLRWQRPDDLPFDEEEWSMLAPHEREDLRRKVWSESIAASEHFASVQEKIGVILVELKEKYGCVVFQSGNGICRTHISNPFVAYIDVEYPEQFAPEVRRALAKVVHYLNSK